MNLEEMYSKNIKVNLSAELIGGNVFLKICTGNGHAELSRFITAGEAETPDILFYWLEHLIDDVVYYCNKKEAEE